jgi:3'-phosphoadenosine 5'-phosphosulfate sulfotransferase (PAPS reductase)/FAD synthetase
MNYQNNRVMLKIKRAKLILENASKNKQKIALSFSGGKDSLTCAILCKQLNLTPELVWFNSGYEFPETDSFVKAAAEKLGFNLREINPKIDPLIAKLTAGYFDLTAINKVNKEILKPWWNTNKEYDLVITGIRVQESRARKMTIGVNGTYFFNKSFKAFSCYPVAYLDANDIFSFITHSDYEYHPIYLKANTIPEREWIRVNWYILSIGERGFYLFLKRNYPEQFNFLVTKCPEIRSYL